MATRADQRKYHYIYKITRTDGSGKYYIGMHSTDDLDDRYFGSGMLLWKSIKKHGKEKHSKEILEFLLSRKELKARERELINEDILADPLCMNLQLGGEGGFTKEAQRNGGLKSNVAKKELWKNSQWSNAYRAALSISHSEKHTFAGRKHTEETKQKMRRPKNIGSANSQFGTCWVTNGVPTKIKKHLLEEYLANGFMRGRK